MGTYTGHLRRIRGLENGVYVDGRKMFCTFGVLIGHAELLVKEFFYGGRLVEEAIVRLYLFLLLIAEPIALTGEYLLLQLGIL